MRLVHLLTLVLGCTILGWADSTTTLTITPQLCDNVSAPLTQSQTFTGPGSLSISMPCVDTAHNRTMTATASSSVTDTSAEVYATTGPVLGSGPGLTAEALLSAFLSRVVPEWAAFARLTTSWVVTREGDPNFATTGLSIDGSNVPLNLMAGSGSGALVGNWQAVTAGSMIGSQVDLRALGENRPGRFSGTNLQVQLTAEFVATPEPSAIVLLTTVLCGFVLVRLKSVKRA